MAYSVRSGTAFVAAMFLVASLATAAHAQLRCAFFCCSPMTARTWTSPHFPEKIFVAGAPQVNERCRSRYRISFASGPALVAGQAVGRGRRLRSETYCSTESVAVHTNKAGLERDAADLTLYHVEPSASTFASVSFVSGSGSPAQSNGAAMLPSYSHSDVASHRVVQ